MYARGSLICSLFSSFSVFWMTVCDDESRLVVASVGADPYCLSSHGFCQMELLVAISELQHGKEGSTAN